MNGNQCWSVLWAGLDDACAFDLMLMVSDPAFLCVRLSISSEGESLSLKSPVQALASDVFYSRFDAAYA